MPEATRRAGPAGTGNRDSLTLSAQRATSADVGKQIAAGDPKGSAGGPNQQPAYKAPLSARQEAFAQARFAGRTIVEAHYAAGFAGDKASASRLNRQHDVQERIAELFRETAAEKTNAIRDLLAITPLCSRPLSRLRTGLSVAARPLV